MKVETLKIKGMHCQHCSDLIRNSLSLVKGVEHTDVSVGSAVVEYDDTVAEKKDIEKAITRFGYEVVDN